MEELKKTIIQLEAEVLKNKKARKKAEQILGRYISNEEYNARVREKIGKLETAIYKTGSLSELFEIFTKTIFKDFSIPVIKIALVEEAAVTRSALNLVPFVILADYYRLIAKEDLRDIPGIKDVPVLKNSELEGYDQLFSKNEMSEMKSLALVPMFSDGKMTGVICFGSHDPEHYNPKKESDLLEKLGIMFALRIDNVLKNEELMAANIRDTLTGLLNVRGKDNALPRMLEENCRFKQFLTLLYLDLDKFKPINDEFGHLAGDKALKHFSYYLKKIARGIDLLARVGGDEFLVVLPGTNQKQAAVFLQRFTTSLRENLFQCDKDVWLEVKFSHGFREVSFDDPTKLEKILEEADKAMFINKAKKEKGRQ